jgi:hypothetical protein
MTTTFTPDLIALDDAETAQLVAEVLTARQAHALYPSGLTHAITRDRLQGAEQRLTGHLAAHGVVDVRGYALELERVASLDDAEDQADAHDEVGAALLSLADMLDAMSRGDYGAPSDFQDRLNRMSGPTYREFQAVRGPASEPECSNAERADLVRGIAAARLAAGVTR